MGFLYPTLPFSVDACPVKVREKREKSDSSCYELTLHSRGKDRKTKWGVERYRASCQSHAMVYA